MSIQFENVSYALLVIEKTSIGQIHNLRFLNEILYRYKVDCEPRILLEYILQRFTIQYKQVTRSPSEHITNI